MTARRLIIAAGGTGGHMFPAQALAEAMLGRGWQVTLSTDERGARYTDAFPTEVVIDVVKAATFARGGALDKIKAPFKIGAGILQSILEFRSERPTVVVGFGGYPSIPSLAAANWLKLPSLIHEQNGVLGRVNTFFAPRVDAVACGTWPTELPEGVEGIATGNPVRAAILDFAGSPYAPPGEGPVKLLVIGGSQGARILSDVVPRAVGMLPAELRERLEISHQARVEDLSRVSSYYRNSHIDADIQPFFTDVPQRIADAHLVVSRAGASSVADLSIIGRPAILVPFAAATGDHQTANARGLVDAGAAIMLLEQDMTPENLADQMAGILQNPDIADMAAAALSLGRPDATDRLVDIVERLANKGAEN